ncbi:YqaA family protein [Thiovibrio sp. JS02]
MDSFISEHSYTALFLLSFLASTVIPLGSEWLLVALLANGGDPTLSVFLATIGNTLGACTTYAIGMHGGPFLITRVLRIDAATRQRAERLYDRHGSWSILFSWLPLIGDPLCLVGGALQMRFSKFFLLALSGKFARYLLVSLITLKAVSL